MLHFSITPFPVLETERLLLRKLREGDAEAIYALRSNDDVNRYIDRQKIESIEPAYAFIKKMNGAIDEGQSLMYWMIEQKSDGAGIGTVCMFHCNHELNRIELGYEMLPECGGKGLMDEAVKAAIVHAIEKMNVKCMEAFTHHDNTRSIKLLERNNFKRNEQREKEVSVEDLGHNIIYTLSV